MSGPTLNRVVADFTADATGDKKIRLKDLRGQNVVLYFYPKDSTPGCTREGLDFKALHTKFRRQKTVILGVSRDSLKSHENFRAKQGFPFDLLSDPDEKLCKQFDVIHEKNMYGKKSMGIQRSTYLIDADGKVAKVWKRVKVDGHDQQVIDALGEL